MEQEHTLDDRIAEDAPAPYAGGFIFYRRNSRLEIPVDKAAAYLGKTRSNFLHSLERIRKRSPVERPPADALYRRGRDGNVETITRRGLIYLIKVLPDYDRPGLLRLLWALNAEIKRYNDEVDGSHPPQSEIDIPSGSVTEDGVPQQAEATPAASPPSLGTTTQRREKVIHWLSDPEMRTLSDREIGRRIGCSPRTVANIRRRLVTKTKAGQEARLKNEDRRAVRAKFAARKAPKAKDAPVPDDGSPDLKSALPQSSDIATIFDVARFRTGVLRGQPCVSAQDVVEALGSTWSESASTSHVPDKWKGLADLGGKYEQLALTREGMFFYLQRSHRPLAQPLQEFVAGNVLPSIQDTGSYGQTQMPDLNDPAVLHKLLLTHTKQLMESRAETTQAKAETEEERKLRLAAEARATAEAERALQQEEIARREADARKEADAKVVALRSAFRDLADDDNLILPSDAASVFRYRVKDFMDWMGAQGLFKWRYNGPRKVSPALATQKATDMGIAINMFRPRPVQEKRDEAGNVVQPAGKKMTNQAYITMNGYLWLHQMLPTQPAQGSLSITPPVPPTRH